MTTPANAPAHPPGAWIPLGQGCNPYFNGTYRVWRPGEEPRLADYSNKGWRSLTTDGGLGMFTHWMPLDPPAALRDYTRHRYECSAGALLERYRQPCTCGLDDLLSAPPAEAATIAALRNSGIDVTCGAYMEVAFTGVTMSTHSCTPPAEPEAVALREALASAARCLRANTYAGHSSSEDATRLDCDESCTDCTEDNFGENHRAVPDDRCIARDECCRCNALDEADAIDALLTGSKP